MATHAHGRSRGEITGRRPSVRSAYRQGLRSVRLMNAANGRMGYRKGTKVSSNRALLNSMRAGDTAISHAKNIRKSISQLSRAGRHDLAHNLFRKAKMRV